MKKTMIVILRLLLIAVLLFAMYSVALADDGNNTAPLFNIVLTPILQALIGLLATVITVKVVPWIRENTTAKQQEALRILIRTLVFAAEQMLESESGIAKLEYVQKQLRERGYTVDRAAIEAAVREMNNSGVPLFGEAIMEEEIEIE